MAAALVGSGLLVLACSGSTTTGIARSNDGGLAGTGGSAAGGGPGSGNASSTGGRAGAGGSAAGGISGASGSAGTAGAGAGGAAGSASGGSAGMPPGSGGSAGGDGGTARVPLVHRAAATTCDNVRPFFDAGAPRGDASVGPPVSCHTHADCTNGDNGRCVGNGHDGWRCTYDACFTDADCVTPPNAGDHGVCACAGGFRSDNNICLYGNCATDADCGGNYCSPALGQCGRYGTFMGYYCHSTADECIDDADCGGSGGFTDPYCTYSDLKGHWVCSTNYCVG